MVGEATDKRCRRSAPVWSAWLDLNQRPHLYQQSRACRYATRRSCRWCATVRGEVMRSCWSGEADQLVGGVDVTVVVRCVPGSTLRCGTRMARPVRNGWGPGAKWRRSDPQHVLRCSQGLPIGTTSLRWGARRRSSSRVASRNPSWPRAPYQILCLKSRRLWTSGRPGRGGLGRQGDPRGQLKSPQVQAGRHSPEGYSSLTGILTYWQCLVLRHEGEHQRISGIDGRAAKRMPGQLAIVVLPKVQATECEDIDSCHPFWRCRESRAIPWAGARVGGRCRSGSAMPLIASGPPARNTELSWRPTNDLGAAAAPGPW